LYWKKTISREALKTKKTLSTVYLRSIQGGEGWKDFNYLLPFSLMLEELNLKEKFSSLVSKEKVIVQTLVT
jgi:hypothetical protein